MNNTGTTGYWSWACERGRAAKSDTPSARGQRSNPRLSRSQHSPCCSKRLVTADNGIWLFDLKDPAVTCMIKSRQMGGSLGLWLRTRNGMSRMTRAEPEALGSGFKADLSNTTRKIRALPPRVLYSLSRPSRSQER